MDSIDDDMGVESMTKERMYEIERTVFYKYLDNLDRDIESDAHIAFEVGRTLGYMQKSLIDELSKEIDDEADD